MAGTNSGMYFYQLSRHRLRDGYKIIINPEHDEFEDMIIIISAKDG